MRSTSKFPRAPGKPRFDVSLAGWVLSLATFSLGSVISPIWQRLAFDGVSIAQRSDYSIKSDISGIFEHKTLLKVVNTTDKPISIEAVEADISSLAGRETSIVGTSVFVATGEGIWASKPNKNGRDEDFPLMIPAKFTEVIAVLLAFRLAGVVGSVDSIAEIGDSSEAFARIKDGASEGLLMDITINGKIRSLRVYPKLREHYFEEKKEF